MLRNSFPSRNDRNVTVVRRSSVSTYPYYGGSLLDSNTAHVGRPGHGTSDPPVILRRPSIVDVSGKTEITGEYERDTPSTLQSVRPIRPSSFYSAESFHGLRHRGSHGSSSLASVPYASGRAADDLRPRAVSGYPNDSNKPRRQSVHIRPALSVINSAHGVESDLRWHSAQTPWSPASDYSVYQGTAPNPNIHIDNMGYYRRQHFRNFYVPQPMHEYHTPLAYDPRLGSVYTPYTYLPAPDIYIPGLEPGGDIADAHIWASYIAEAKEQDKDTVATWNQNMDVILVFAALFSAILTAFIIQFYQLLQPSPQQPVVDILTNITGILTTPISQQNYSTADGVFGGTQFFVPDSVLWVNGLWFSSLACSLAAAMIAMLVKQWLQFFKSKDMIGTAYNTAQQRQYQFNAIVTWHVPVIISALPFVMHLAVALFFVGLVIQLWQINMIIAIITLAFLAPLLVAYAIALLLPLVYPACPYKTSGIVQLQDGVHYVHLLFWKILYRCVSWINLFLHESNSPWVFPHRRLYKIYATLYTQTPSQVQQDNIISQQTKLDLDSIIWLLRVSEKPENVSSALVFISELQYSPELTESLIKYNILDLLVHKAKVPLPPQEHGFWRNLDQIYPDHILFNRLSIAIPYMRSLISVWHHPPYLSSIPPPAVSEPLHYGIYSPLFGDCILLWRLLRRDRDIDTLTQCNIDGFIWLLCTEAHYYILHPEGHDFYRYSLEKLAFNTLDPLYDVIELLQDASSLTNDSVNILIDALTFRLSHIYQKSGRIRNSEILHILMKILHLYNMSNITLMQNLITCLELFVLESDDNVIMKIYSNNKIFQHETEFFSFSIKILKNLVQTRLHDPEGGWGLDPIVTIGLYKICECILEQPYPSKEDSNFFLTLPIAYADNFLYNISEVDLLHWKSFHAVIWTLDLLLEAYHEGPQSYIGESHILDLLIKLFCIKWSDDQWVIVWRKILPLFSEILNKSEHPNHYKIFTTLSSCLWLQRKKGAVYQKLLAEILDTGALAAVCRLLVQRGNLYGPDWDWIKILDLWCLQIKEAESSSCENQCTEMLKDAVYNFNPLFRLKHYEVMSSVTGDTDTISLHLDIAEQSITPETNKRKEPQQHKNNIESEVVSMAITEQEYYRHSSEALETVTERVESSEYTERQ